MNLELGIMVKRLRRLHISYFIPQTSNPRGFTLIEVIVGMGIFVIIIAVVLAVFLASVRASRKSIQNQNVTDNGRFVLEKISRAVRQSTIRSSSSPSRLDLCHATVGYTSLPCPCTASGLRCLEYTFDSVRSRILETSGDASGNAVTAPITSNNVAVNSLIFSYPGGLVRGDIQQPRAVISLFIKEALTATKPEEKAEIRLQTTITPRRLDLLP